MNKKIAIYARVSTLEQAEHGYSIGEQVDKLKKYSDIHDYSIYKEYVDGGYSGSKLDRPAMLELIEDAKNHKFEMVIVYKLDRLSRNLQNALYLINDVFRDNNISFASLSENIDLSTASGELNFNMFASFAEFERANIRDRMAMGAYARAKSGRCASPSRVPFGYEYNGGILKKNETTAPIVKSVFDMYLQGLSLAKILIHLNNDGFIGKDKPWRLSTIGTLLRTKTYIGVIKYRDEYFKGLHEPIVSSADFEEVQRQIKIRQDLAYKKSNSTRPFQSKYMLSGLLYCGKCGKRLAIIQYGKTKGTNVYKYRRYQCVGKQSHYKRMVGYSEVDIGLKCDTPNYEVDKLEETVVQKINDLKLNFDNLEDQNTHANDFEITKENKLLEEINVTENKLSKLVDLYLNEKIDLDIYENKKSEYDLKISLLKKNKNAIKKDDKYLTRKDALNLIENISYSDASYENKKEIANKLINKIDVNVDKLTIYWNF